MMKLFTDRGNHHSLKVFIAAELVGISLDVEHVDSQATVVPFLTRNVLPVLETDATEYLFSANAIVRYLLSHAGKDLDDIKVASWLEWESADLQAALSSYLPLLYTSGKADSQKLQPFLSKLDHSLTGGNFVVQNLLSAADICLFAALFPLYEHNSSFFDKFPNISAWVVNLLANPAFKASIALVTGGRGSSAMKSSILVHPAINSLPSTRTTSRDNGSSPIDKQTAEGETAHEFSQEEIRIARETFHNGKKGAPKPAKRNHPILPKKELKNILITSALPYVNNIPHLGNIVGCVLSADVFSRFCRLRNYNVLYICGTDEYGTATETKALEEGLTPQQICDKYFKLHSQVYEWFNIDFDYFGRTTTQEQTKIAQDIFWGLHTEKCLLPQTVEQLKCEECNRFLADRFVEGTCPLCNYDDARGDQCDKCGKLINATDLKNPRCKVCTKTPVIRSSDHLFLDLPKLEPKLEKFLDQSTTKGNWTSNAKLITSSWVRDGLKPRCITRDLKWGTPVPLEPYTSKVFYVWFDAPIGYPSITANYTPEWETWWKNPQEVELYQFMAKDNVPFHSVVFPCSLLGSGEEWTLVNHLIATEYLNYEDSKFSKSRGVGVFGHHAEETGIPADIWRFYLLFIRPESQDSYFNWADFVLKNNSELLNNLGNFINRSLTFLEKNFGAVVQEMKLEETDCQLLAAISQELKQYVNLLERVKIRDALRHILNISRLGNQHIQFTQPWLLIKGSPEEKSRAGTVISLCVNISCLLAVMLHPYMPETSNSIQKQLNASPDVFILNGDFFCFLDPGHKIGVPSPLFAKIEQSRADQLRKQYAGTSDQTKTASEEVTKPVTTIPTPIVNPAEVQKLTQAVTKQGDIVRKLKADKAGKEKIDAEVAKLLALKKELSLASGVQPETGKKNKKGKKK